MQPFSRGALVAFICLAIAHGEKASGTPESVRGVSPNDAHLYRATTTTTTTGKGTWRCLHSDQEIPFSAINDDYCDCVDGSDEPGTSACANSTFYCLNEGHLPATILSSRVNDGICDPECCDGSDEYESGKHCPNVCASVGKAYRKKRQEEENVRRAGSKIRAKYIADRRKALESLTAEVTRLEVEVEVAKEREARAKGHLDAAEKMDAHVLEKKKASPLYQTLRNHQEAVRALMKKQGELVTEVEKLTDLLDDLAKGYNPNYQDMAVKGAVMAYRSWRRGGDPTDDGVDTKQGEETPDDQANANAVPVQDEEPAKLNALRDDGEWPRSKLRDIVDVDPLTLMDDEQFKGGAASNDESGILFRIHEYLPDAIVPYFEAAVDTILDLLLKANIIAEVKRKSRKNVEGAFGGETENVTAARTKHRSAQSDLRSIESELQRKQNDMDTSIEKWGQEGEFKALDGKCVERNMGEYTYEFCFFQGATQKPNRGHGNVSLGRFSRFAPKDDRITPDDPSFYHRQIYDAGQRCWNGPDRSLIVDFVCAPENALLDVFEGEKCIYEAKVSTPAICLPLVEETASHAAKDEL